MAIYGKETSYGSVTGSFDLLDALASLAYEGRAAIDVRGEFISALKLMDQGVPRWQLRGSYAGATGYPQFMPSVALRLRADGDGDGYADIWRNEDDAFASIANYLRDAGWKRNVPWGVPVRIPTESQSRRNQVADQSAALPAGLSPSQPLADGARVADARRRAGAAQGLPDNEMATPDGDPRRQCDGLSADHQLSRHPRLQLLEFLRIWVGLLANAIARR